jgi:hypothetical protein
MIITKLSGGLGNQMFQYAAGATLASKLKTENYLDLSWFDLIKGRADVAQRTYELDQFGIIPLELGLKQRAILRVRSPIVFAEKKQGYNPDLWHLEGNVLLDGYWQSYKYLEDNRDKILRIFSFPEVISDKNRRLLEHIKTVGSISLHIRRGDYVHIKKTNKIHGLLSLEYYHQAVDLLLKNIRNPHIFIFSDDLVWAKNNLKLNMPITFVSNQLDRGVEDMRLMAACKYNIVANSSFSWWGAWLNQSPDKRIIAPKHWFRTADLKNPDLIPDKWIRL